MLAVPELDQEVSSQCPHPLGDLLGRNGLLNAIRHIVPYKPEQTQRRHAQQYSLQAKPKASLKPRKDIRVEAARSHQKHWYSPKTAQHSAAQNPVGERLQITVQSTLTHTLHWNQKRGKCVNDTQTPYAQHSKTPPARAKKRQASGPMHYIIKRG